MSVAYLLTSRMNAIEEGETMHTKTLLKAGERMKSGADMLDFHVIEYTAWLIVSKLKTRKGAK